MQLPQLHAGKRPSLYIMTLLYSVTCYLYIWLYMHTMWANDSIMIGFIAAAGAQPLSLWLISRWYLISPTPTHDTTSYLSTCCRQQCNSAMRDSWWLSEESLSLKMRIWFLISLIIQLHGHPWAAVTHCLHKDLIPSILLQSREPLGPLLKSIASSKSLSQNRISFFTPQGSHSSDSHIALKHQGYFTSDTYGFSIRDSQSLHIGMLWGFPWWKPI